METYLNFEAVLKTSDLGWIVCWQHGYPWWSVGNFYLALIDRQSY